MPNFVVVIGPQAVGKMAVGKELANRLKYKFSHNHHSIEFGLEFFEYGTPPFNKINQEIRKIVFETMKEFESGGFVFTYVAAFNLEEEIIAFAELLNEFRDYGWEIYVVELLATLETRLKRNKTQQRLEAKVSKRDTEASEFRLLKSLEKYILNSTAEYPFPFDKLDLRRDQYLKLDNTKMGIKQQVDKIIEVFEL